MGLSKHCTFTPELNIPPPLSLSPLFSSSPTVRPSSTQHPEQACSQYGQGTAGAETPKIRSQNLDDEGNITEIWIEIEQC